MAHAVVDYSLNVRKYSPSCNPAAVDGIVRYLGMALRKPDSATVAADEAERRRLRESFLKRRLRLTAPEHELDAALSDVLDRTAGDSRRSRVTVCYLLAERFGKLPLFV